MGLHSAGKSFSRSATAYLRAIPKTRFVAAHMGEQPEDLAALAAMLDAHPNVQLDMSARVAELGRQPFTARRFFLRFADRILFGADLLPEESMYRAHYRFFETDDEYFDYPSHASRQGRWQIYGLPCRMRFWNAYIAGMRWTSGFLAMNAGEAAHAESARA